MPSMATSSASSRSDGRRSVRRGCQPRPRWRAREAHRDRYGPAGNDLGAGLHRTDDRDIPGRKGHGATGSGGFVDDQRRRRSVRCGHGGLCSLADLPGVAVTSKSGAGSPLPPTRSGWYANAEPLHIGAVDTHDPDPAAAQFGNENRDAGTVHGHGREIEHHGTVPEEGRSTGEPVVEIDQPGLQRRIRSDDQGEKSRPRKRIEGPFADDGI